MDFEETQNSEGHNSPIHYIMATNEKINVLQINKGFASSSCTNKNQSDKKPRKTSDQNFSNSCVTIENDPIKFSISKCYSPIKSGKYALFKLKMRFPKYTEDYLSHQLTIPEIVQQYYHHAKDNATYCGTPPHAKMKSYAARFEGKYNKNLELYNGILHDFIILKEKKTLVLGLEEVLVQMSVMEIFNQDLVIKSENDISGLNQVFLR